MHQNLGHGAPRGQHAPFPNNWCVRDTSIESRNRTSICDPLYRGEGFLVVGGLLAYLASIVRHTPWHTFLAALICSVLTACSVNRVPATNAYLRAYESASENLMQQVQQLPRLIAPRRPYLPTSPTWEERRGNVLARRNYPDALARYFGALSQRCQALSRLYGQAQGQFAALNGAGVDTDAVRLVALRVTTIGQRRKEFVELDRLCQLRRDALLRGQSDEVLDSLVLGIGQGVVDGAAGGPETAILGGLIGAVKSLLGEASKSQVEQDSIREQAEKLNASVADLSLSIVEFKTQRAALMAQLPARYPGPDWSFLASKRAATQP
jgi:hypothetical protein